MITLTCDECGSSYQAKPYMVGLSVNHFCGLPCYGKWQQAHRKGVGSKKVSVPCFMCGGTIERSPSSLKEHNFCGRFCAATWRSSGIMSGPNNSTWQGGHMSYRGENWNRQRIAARKRDNDTCQRCGVIARGLPVHHVTPFHLFTDYRDANKIENLVTLCPKCHGKAEIAFLRNNPDIADLRRFPFVVPLRPCAKCGVDFTPRSPAAKVCDACCTASCIACGKVFVSRRATSRTLKYCSRSCRSAHLKRDPQACQACGKVFIADRPGVLYCSRGCHLTRANPRRRFSVKRRLAAQE